ncbi:hypothetical protein ACLOJK_006909 [Asimina triloba]
MAEEGERCAPNRVRPSREEGNLSDFGPSFERAFGSLSSEWSTHATESEGVTPPPNPAQLKEELEASRTELMLRGYVTHPSAVVEYLRSDAYHRRMEFEQAHHSLSGNIRALSDVAALYPKLDLSSLYQNVVSFYLLFVHVVAHDRFSVGVVYDCLFCFMLSTEVALVSGFSVSDRGSPMTAGFTHS